MSGRCPTTPGMHESPRGVLVVAETCPDCGGEIRESEAYCFACGMSRGVATATPREDYLRACVAALELLRQTSRRVRPIRETVVAEGLLETAVARIRSGCQL